MKCYAQPEKTNTKEQLFRCVPTTIKSLHHHRKQGTHPTETILAQKKRSHLAQKSESQTKPKFPINPQPD